MENVLIGQAKYFITFIDDHSRKVFVNFFKSKPEVTETFVNFKQMVERQTERKIKIVRMDNSTEYCNHGPLQRFGHRTSYFEYIHFAAKWCGGTHESNIGWTCQMYMIVDAKLQKSFSVEAVNMAAYIVNRSSNSLLANDTPESVWSGRKVDIGNMRIFGPGAMVHIPKQWRKKWNRKATKLFSIGYAENKKGYRCMDPETGRIVTSRDVVFLEPDQQVDVSNPIVSQENVVSVGTSSVKNWITG